MGERHLTLPQSSLGINLQRCSYTCWVCRRTNPYQSPRDRNTSQVWSWFSRGPFKEDDVGNNFCSLLIESYVEPLCIHPLLAAVLSVLIICSINPSHWCQSKQECIILASYFAPFLLRIGSQTLVGFSELFFFCLTCKIPTLFPVAARHSGHD